MNNFLYTFSSNQELLDFNDFKLQVLEDYKLIILSRECSIISRREVLSGKAKFGIFGDGKELAQICLSKFFKNGDFRSGYYRDQTILFANNSLNIHQYFAQLYANTELDKEPNSGGRQMNCHFATRLLDKNGNWKSHLNQKNTTADISCTAAQMLRAIGIAQASKIYRELNISSSQQSLFSEDGNEVCFATIGDASTTEGYFYESVNAMCTLQIPLILSIWDDGYGISVPWEYQRSKQNISEILSGFQRSKIQKGCEIIQVPGWDYTKLIKAYETADRLARKDHIPVIVHVCELTQPQGHSTSGSHERYKSKSRMIFEKEFDCLKKFKEWILNFSFIDNTNNTYQIASEEELFSIEKEVKYNVRKISIQAWEEYQQPIRELRNEALIKIRNLSINIPNNKEIDNLILSLKLKKILFKKDIFKLIKDVLRKTKNFKSQIRNHLVDYFHQIEKKEIDNYSSYLYSKSKYSAINVPFIQPEYSKMLDFVDGRIIIRDNFEILFNKYPKLIAFGEDVGKIGDVNQGMEGLQKKFGESRIFDTGIREATIIGQAIGLAIRGFRPIAEIQYLDYIYYGLQILVDDVATLRYRTKNGQKVPLIIRTRGHRLEGMWHAGSPIGVLINALRGIYLLVPRDMTRAAGFYNTMLQSDDPCIIIESLNGYRLKERRLINLGKFTTPIGKIEITNQGNDVTVVTYGSTWKNVVKAKNKLKELKISIEIIDCQSLIPFDIFHETVESIKKTNRLVIVDEDVPGGASSYLLQKILEEQNAYRYLDAKPVTITAKEHRCPYGTDGDYFSKPSTDDIIEKIYQIMYEYDSIQFPKLY